MGAQRGRDVFGGRSSGHVFVVPEDAASVLECAVGNKGRAGRNRLYAWGTGRRCELEQTVEYR